MAKTSQLPAGPITVTGDGLGPLEYFPPGFPIVNQAAPDDPLIVANLTTGNNTITVPANTKTMTISPPVGSTNAKALKVVSGDTGWPIHPSLPGIYPVPSGTTSIIVNSAGSEAIQILFA